ncbi:hypothetical protein [Spiroplasma endosymbiont of Zeiraphera isertana]|uniref:hypothetical protein n=1 Tax=Spiroplasma endosymbiont of Zeiraphera isertana TaxID=3066313 RepID=UPI00313AD72F
MILWKSISFKSSISSFFAFFNSTKFHIFFNKGLIPYSFSIWTPNTATIAKTTHQPIGKAVSVAIPKAAGVHQQSAIAKEILSARTEIIPETTPKIYVSKAKIKNFPTHLPNRLPKLFLLSLIFSSLLLTPLIFSLFLKSKIDFFLITTCLSFSFFMNWLSSKNSFLQK